MIQLEFQTIVKHLPVVEPKPRRCKVKLLAFISDLVRRKAKRGLSDMDVLVMLALVTAPEGGQRFYRLVELVGRSTTGTWNSLERLENYGYVVCKGPPGKHTYLLTNEGVKELRNLAGK